MILFSLVFGKILFLICTLLAFIFIRKDATLKEISHLVRDVHPEARKKGTCFNFALVFPETFGPAYRRREIGTVYAGISGEDDKKTLEDARLQIGDYMDIAVIYPENAPRERNREFSRKYW